MVLKWSGSRIWKGSPPSQAPTSFRSPAVEIDFGLSRGRPRARSQTREAVTWRNNKNQSTTDYFLFSPPVLWKGRPALCRTLPHASHSGGEEVLSERPHSAKGSWPFRSLREPLKKVSSGLDHNDPSKPSHRLTNGLEPSKTIESDGSNIKKPS